MDTLEARTGCRAKKTTPTGGQTEELSARSEQSALGGLDKNILRGLRRQVDFVRVLSLYFFLAVETRNGITRLKRLGSA